MEKPVKGEKLKDIEEISISDEIDYDGEEEFDFERMAINDYCSVQDYFMDHRKILSVTDEL